MRILLLAGEESGVLYARQIRAELLRRDPSAEIRGYEDEGFRTEDLAVMGIGQVLKRIFYFLRVRRTMERRIDAWRPDVVCTVDYPGMNLRLAAYAKARGIRAVHVVCPQVWAWRQGRIPKIEAALDRLCCFFPFEPALFSPGFATFVGHPLVEAFAARAAVRRDAAGAARRGRTLAVLPGSRMGEIEQHLPVLLEVVATLLRDPCLGAGALRVVVPAANERALQAISGALARAQLPAGSVEVRHGGARAVLCAADAAVVASGTATLEAALANCPTVLVYRVGWLFAAIARRVIKGVRHVGLANIVAEKAGLPCPMPELLQEDFTAERVRAALLPWLTDASAAAAARQALADTMRLLRREGGDAIGGIVAQLGADGCSGPS
ncbi:MAG: lipid-A-disaccharide synthase [Kiritimatiellia bacterium]